MEPPVRRHATRRRSRRAVREAGDGRADSTGSIPPSMKSSPESRTPSGKSGPTSGRTASRISITKRHASLDGAAVLVVTEVGRRREELVDQVPVGGVELDAVEAALLAAPGRRDERSDDSASIIVFVIGRGHHVHRRRGDALARDRLPGAPVGARRRARAAGTPGCRAGGGAERSPGRSRRTVSVNTGMARGRRQGSTPAISRIAKPTPPLARSSW